MAALTSYGSGGGPTTTHVQSGENARFKLKFPPPDDGEPCRGTDVPRNSITRPMLFANEDDDRINIGTKLHTVPPRPLVGRSVCTTDKHDRYDCFCSSLGGALIAYNQ